MQVKSVVLEGVAIFEVAGEINIMTSPELKKHFEKHSSKKVLVDMAQVSYIDSSGLATLVEILKKTKLQGGVLGLSGMSNKVKSLFEITKLDKLFSIFLSQDEAMAKIRN